MWNNNNNTMPYSSNPYNNYLNYNTYSSQHNNQQQQIPTQNNIIWVKGKENARSMQLPPNSTVILLDSEVGKFYIKTTDDIGLGKIRVFNYTEEPDVETTQTSIPNIDLSNYVTKQQLQEIVKEMKKEDEQSISTIKSKRSEAINQQF